MNTQKLLRGIKEIYQETLASFSEAVESVERSGQRLYRYHREALSQNFIRESQWFTDVSYAAEFRDDSLSAMIRWAPTVRSLVYLFRAMPPTKSSNPLATVRHAILEFLSSHDFCHALTDEAVEMDELRELLLFPGFPFTPLETMCLLWKTDRYICTCIYYK